ncbi:MAG: hypothetical protein ING24_15345 [Roseomonas sp.]|nr:hypothetical protein [Roseomonas sp.]
MSLGVRYGLPTVIPHCSEARLAPLCRMRHRAFSRNFKMLKYSILITEEWRFEEEKKWRE